MRTESSADSNALIGVVGASARAAAFSLLRAGYRVVAADLFADADLRRYCPAIRIASYPEEFARWLTKANCDRWLYTGALENHPDLVDQLTQLCPLLGNSGAGLRRIRDPLLLQRVLKKAGFLFPETVVASDRLPREGHWLGKTCQGSSGHGVELAVSASHSALGAAPYYQRYVAGTPLSAVFYGCQLWGVTRQLVGETWSGAAKFQYCGSIGPWPLSCECEQYLRRLGKLLCDEFELDGWFGVDLIHGDNRLWIIEVNPRYTAAVEVVQQSLDGPGSYIGKVILYAKQPLNMDARLSDALLRSAGGLKWPRLADIPTAGSAIASGQPILTAFATARQQEAVFVALRQRALDLESQLYPGASVG